MRFRATDEALKKFANDSNNYSQTDFDTLKKGPIWAANRRYNDVDMQIVGWDQVRTIRKPQLYMAGRVERDQNGYQWYGDLIVDPDTHFVYVDVGGD